MYLRLRIMPGSRASLGATGGVEAHATFALGYQSEAIIVLLLFAYEEILLVSFLRKAGSSLTLPP